MATTFAPRTISKANVTGIRGTLVQGVGFYVDGRYRYAVADRSVFELRVVRRIGNMSFTNAVTALPAGFRVVTNGNYFAGTRGLYARAALGVIDSKDVGSVGDVYQGGVLAGADAPDAENPANFFYFGSIGPAPLRYECGPGNAPGTIRDGMGGLGPLILRNPTTGKPLRYGIGNRYATNPKKTTIPSSAAEWRDCIQRNNDTYRSIQGETSSGAGVCVVAVNDTENILLLLIKPHGDVGDLDTIRDKLFEAGFDGACFTDGSNSACMAVDRVFEFAPAGYKDNLIEYGFSLFRLEKDVHLRVDFLVLTVLSDGSTFGKGKWTLRAEVNGVVAGSFAGREVDDKQVVTLGWSRTLVVHPNAGERLRILITGVDEAGLNDDLGTVSVRYDQGSPGPWGVGPQQYDSPEGHYRVSAVISLLP